MASCHLHDNLQISIPDFSHVSPHEPADLITKASMHLLETSSWQHPKSNPIGRTSKWSTLPLLKSSKPSIPSMWRGPCMEPSNTLMSQHQSTQPSPETPSLLPWDGPQTTTLNDELIRQRHRSDPIGGISSFRGYYTVPWYGRFGPAGWLRNRGTYLFAVSACLR